MVFKLAKLARRLAVLKSVCIIAILGACADSSPMAPAVSDSLPPDSSVFSLSVSPNADSGSVGRTLQFMATLLDSAGRTLSGHAIAWTIADTAVARVDTTGLVTYLATGRTAVAAAAGGRESHAALIVVPVPVASMSIEPSAVTVSVGTTARLTATPRDSAARQLTERPVTWVSGEPGVATVDSTGAVSALAVGQAVVTATSEGHSATATVSVTTVPVADVAVSPTSASLFEGQAVQLTAGARDSAGNPLAGRGFSWTSDDTLVARVTPAGLVTGVRAGAASVVANSEGKADTARITVVRVPVSAVTVGPATVNLAVGGTTQLTATPRDSAGSPLTGRTVVWTTSLAGVATVSATGLVVGVGTGTATITATSEGRSGTATITVTASPAPRVGYYVAPTGTSAGSGSISQPWNLATALSGGGGRIVAGDTIWLRGGTYAGAFRSTLSGTSAAPVVVRQYPGERAIIDGAGTPTSISVFAVAGAWSVFWGFEITNSDLVRTTQSTANNVRPNVVSNYASHTRYVNLVVHDGGVAFYNEAQYSDVEISGCIVYNNGWQGPDRGHGHGIYLKSNTGPVVARDNVVFNQFGYGIHVYSDAGSGQLNNILLEGNVAFNNGTLSTNSSSPNILVGGAAYATGDVLRDNVTYFSPGIGGTNVQVGYGTLANGDIALEGNTMTGGNPVLQVGYWDRASFSGNTMLGSGQVVALNDNSLSGYTWSSSRQYRDPLSASWVLRGTSYPWLLWQTLTGLGLTDLVGGGTPQAAQVVVRPNLHEQGRATVVLTNWAGAAVGSVNLSGVLAAGDRYEIRSVQALFGEPVASGMYAGGSISIPLAGVTPPAPVGFTSSRAPTTGPAFEVFLVTRL